MMKYFFSVGDSQLGVTFSDSRDFFLCDSPEEAKERFHKFLKAFIEDHPYSYRYQDFALFNFGYISNSVADYSHHSLSSELKFNPVLICTSSCFPDIEAYRDQVLGVFKRSLDIDSISSIVREQLAIINNNQEY